jgi:molybdopterin-guanine dinucleotide biosynthesis protein A
VRRSLRQMPSSALCDAAAIVLVGGRSSRMGEPKVALEWHGSTLLQRTAALLLRTVSGPVIVVRAPGQDLPALPPGVEVTEDSAEGRGPLEGIASGFGAVLSRAELAFVCSTDLPFLHPAFVRRVLRDLGPEWDIVLPVARGYPQPLAAAYRTALHPRALELVAAGRLRPVMLAEGARVLRLDDAALLADPSLVEFDPALDSLLNINRPEEYRTARERPAPEVTVRRGEVTRVVRAASVSAAAAAVGVELGCGDVAVALNGDPLAPALDGRPGGWACPLVAGDVVTFGASGTISRSRAPGRRTP